MIGLLITLSGLITSGLSTAREWDTKTVKELLLSPTTSGAIITGKILAGFVTSCMLGLLILLLGYVLGWTRPGGYSTNTWPSCMAGNRRRRKLYKYYSANHPDSAIS